MPPKRKTTTRAAVNPKAGATGTTEFVCPECGRTFQRAAALGAHRRRAHNVVGKTAKTGSRPARKRTTPATARPAARAAAAPATNSINRNALLKTLFPNGIPANEEAIRSVNDWLGEAERLAGLK